MKMNFKYAMMATALTLGFASCSNEENTEIPSVGGEYTTMAISVEIPKATRGDIYPGTAAESELKEISVWIYDVNGSASTIKHIPVSGTNTVTEIATTSGSKNVYVGANLPESIKAGITGAGRTGLATYVHNITKDLLTSNGIAMFSPAPGSINLVASPEGQSTPESNKLTVKVERMVAKIVAGKNSVVETSKVTNGSFLLDGMEYSVKQVNRYMFTTKQTTDPNYDDFKFGWDYSTSSQIANPNATANAYGLEQFDNTVGYQSVGIPTNATEWDDAPCFYVPENLESVACHGANTYASIRVKFVPDNGAATDGSFATVTNKDGDITGYYPSVADAVNAAGVDDVVSGLYENGNVYYRIYPVKETNYNVIRNDYYRLKINAINGLGNWKDTSDENDKPQPGKPIVETDTKMDITVEVMPWVLFEEGHELDK